MPTTRKFRVHATAAAPIAMKAHVPFTCMVCGSSSITKARAQMTKWTAIKCSHCEVAATYPWPDLKTVGEFYASFGPDLLFSESDLHLDRLHSPLVRMLSAGRERKLSFFDYGCGGGSFLRAVAKEGHAVLGAEFSPKNCETVARSGIECIDLRSSPLRDLRPRTFDRITLFQVVEHLLDPVSTLRDIRELLSPQGLLYLECPNEDGWMYKTKSVVRKLFHRENFYGSLNPPFHVHGFNKHSLSTLLRRAGFEIVELSDYGMKDRIRQPETQTFYPGLRELITNRTKWRPYFIAKWMIGTSDRIISRLFGRGAGLYALARRKS